MPRATACPDGSGASQSAAPQAKANAARQRATARPDDSGAPQPLALNSGAAQSAALSGAVQKLVEEVKQFGRMPKRNHGTSTEERAEDRLYRRFLDHRDSIPNEVLKELHALGGVAELADDPEQAVRKLVEDVKQFGRIPKLNNGRSDARASGVPAVRC